MLVVHGLWTAAGRLAVWGESSTLPTSAPRRAGRQPRERAHPFAASTESLSTALGALAAKTTAATVSIRIPSRGGAPGDSPELVRTDTIDEPSQARKDTPPEFAAWRVPSIEFDVDDALATLLDIGGLVASGSAGGDTMTFGATVRHLVAVAEFARDVAVRGRVLPTVVITGNGPEALWRPLLTGPDAASTRDLAMALPPAGRAEVISGNDATPAAIVAAALDALTDAAVRAAIGGQRIAPARLSNAVPSVTRSWLGGLTGRERRFTADARALVDLKHELDVWQHDAAGGPVRACFRLVEPTADDPDIDDIDDDEDDDLNAAADDDLNTAEDDDIDIDDDGDDDDDDDDGHVGAATGIRRTLTRPRRADRADRARRAGRAAATKWRVDFALQAADEPSLLIDADQVWRSKGALTALARQLDSPQETMLAELGRASRLWPALTTALTTARPATLMLDTAGAHAFLREGAPLLHAAGFGVLLPSWWTKPNARFGARLNAQSRTAPATVAGRSGFGLDSLLDYKWELALGDEALTEKELRALAQLKTPLVRIRGQWVELDAKRLAAGLKLIKAGGQMSVGELLHTGLAMVEGPGGLPVTAVTADGAIGDLLAGTAERHLAPIEAPAGFRGTLRPYQKRGLAWLSFLESVGLGGVLADDMGLGKTVQLLALIAGDPAEAAPTLLVCPTSLVGNWQREAAKFTPDLRVHVHHGAERARGKAFTDAVDAADIVITTYALAARDAEPLGKITWHRVVVDEAQAIKNAATRQAEAVRALPARSRFAVTGTPVENRLADLWSIMEFASPGLLGGATAFKRNYAEPIERHGDDDVAARLRRVTGPFVLRRVKTDKSIISDLPEKLEMDVLCNLTAEQASLYQAVVDDMLAKIEASDGIERRGLVLATMTKLKQVCNHPAQLLHDDSRLAGRSGKLDRLEEILEEVLAAGEKALLFTQYATFGGMLRAHLGARFGREVMFLHGGVDQRERDAMVTRFQAEDAGAPPLFVLSLKAGGTGLTLTAANHVVHVDRWWNPAVEDQATDRAFRIGQRRAVQVRKFVCAGTVEEKIAGMIRDKRGLAAKIVGSGEQWLTEFSTTQLRDLFALESGAVVE